MPVAQRRLSIPTQGPGLVEVTRELEQAVRSMAAAGDVDVGLCHVFIHHTSASLVIQENADPSARRDLEAWLARLAPEGDPRYTHTAEGPDDMPAHLRAAVTRTSETIPITDGALGLGTWQGLYIFEHRRGAHRRSLTVSCQW